jgi:hypothetical protein
MPERLRHRLSFANVVSVLALFFALGGSVYAAAKIDGKEIERQSIPGNRIKPGSLATGQIREASLRNVRSAKALSQVFVSKITVLLDPSNPNVHTIPVNCGFGAKALGGGGVLANPSSGANITDQGINADDSGYVVDAFSGSAPTAMTVSVVCAPVKSVVPGP